MGGARCARLGAAVLAEEIILVGGRQRRVRVGRTDHAELERIDAKFLFELEPELETGAGVLVLQHLRLLELGQVEIALVPQLEAGELVIRRQEGMRLAVALDLRHLIHRFKPRPRLGIGARQSAAVEIDQREHASVGQVAVVRDGEHLAAGLLGISIEELPQHGRVLAVEGGERHDLVGLVLAVAEDHDAMQVVAAVVGSPFVADQRGKPSGLVVALGGAGVVLPDRARELSAQHRFRRRAGANRADDLDRRLARTLATGCHQVVPAPQRRVGHQGRVALLDFLRGAQPLGMIGDHQEIERAAQPDRLAGGGNHLLAASEAVGRLRAERVAEGRGIQRIGGVQMGITPENARRDNFGRHKANNPAPCRAVLSRPGTRCRYRCRLPLPCLGHPQQAGAQRRSTGRRRWHAARASFSLGVPLG